MLSQARNRSPLDDVQVAHLLMIGKRAGRAATFAHVDAVLKLAADVAAEVYDRHRADSGPDPQARDLAVRSRTWEAARQIVQLEVNS